MVFQGSSAAISHTGKVRSNNQDSGYAGSNLFVVADGMGGHAGGEFASAICVNTVEEIVMSMELAGDAPVDEDDPVELAREKLRYAIRLAGRRIFEKASEDPEYHGMGTTTVALLVQNDPGGMVGWFLD